MQRFPPIFWSGAISLFLLFSANASDHPPTPPPSEAHPAPAPHSEKKEEATSAHPPADKTKHTKDEHSPSTHDKTGTHQTAHSKEAAPKPDEEVTITPQTLLNVLENQAPYQGWEVSTSLAEWIIEISPENSPEAAKAMLIVARQATKDGNYSQALLYYERWKSRVIGMKIPSPELPQSLLETGRTYRSAGAYQLATDAFYLAMTASRSLGQGPSRTIQQAQWEIAETSFALKDWPRARRLFEMYTESNPDTDPLTHAAFFRLGICNFNLGEEDAAAANLTRATTHSPRNPMAPEAHFLMMKIYLHHENYPLASQSITYLSKTTTGMGREVVNEWKQRVGQELFKHFFEKASYSPTIPVLDSLATLDPGPEWQNQVTRWKVFSLINSSQWQKALDTIRTSSSTPVTKKNTNLVAVEKPSADTKKEASLKPYGDICEWVLNFKKKEEELELPPANPENVRLAPSQPSTPQTP